ncbi:MAG: chemotaxis protein CheA [Myxococcota bacterium]
MDMDKYRALFIEESREHLSELSRLLAGLEKNPEPSATVDECFRHIHSVKGMAASMGYDPIANLAHRFEDGVDTYRGTQRAPSGEVVDLFLRGVDALVDQVESIAAKQALDEHIDLLRELSSVLSQELEPPQSAPTHVPVPPSAGPVTLIVELEEDTNAPAVRAFLVYRKLDGLVNVLECEPPLSQIRSGGFSGRTVRFSLDGEIDAGAILEEVKSVPDVKSAVLETRSADEPNEVEPVPSEEVKRSRPVVESSTVRVRVDILDRLIDGVGELFIVREQLRNLLDEGGNPELRSALGSLESRIRDLHGQVLAVRMTPLRTLTDRYPRIVRDLARNLSKDVDVVVDGDEIELDRAILEALDTPFLHTLRNAVDHGIEPPDERIESGKANPAKLSLSASRDRDTVVVTIADDGRGLDADRLRDVAVERGLMTRTQADALTAREAHFLICLPGFSTKAEVSDVSGRGVGMDVVRGKIEGLSGTLDIESEPGVGTQFIFRLPLTLAIINALLIEVQGRRFAIPVAKVVAVREVGDDGVEEAGGARYLSFRHTLAPIYPLGEVLGLGSQRDAEQVVVFEDGRDLAAVAVERIVGYQEIVVKPLGEPLDRMESFSGATILGDGEPILILDLVALLRTRILQ